MSGLKANRKFDLSGGIQTATSWLLKRPNEMVSGKNAMFSDEIGAAVRRLGFKEDGDDFETDHTPTGFFVARFNGGSKRFVAVNNAADTQTVIRAQDVSDGSWDDVSTTDYGADATVHFTFYLDYVYVSGFESDGTPLAPMVIDSALTKSTTLNLIGCPKAGFFREFGGSMYAINVEVGSSLYPDRAYKSSPPLGVVTYIKGAQTGTLTTLSVDSVKYLKVGMAIDIYTAETSTKIEDLTITAVDKAENTITFASTSVTVADNDEIWLDGRHDELTILWNTDHPTAEEADFLRLLPGTDSSSAITGAAKSNNRLFLFTRNSTSKWDGANLVTFSNTIGCVSHNSIKNIEDDWLIWVDANGRVRARNDASGQQEDISRAIRKNVMKDLTTAQLEATGAVTFDNQYKLYVGTIDGKPTRVVYDFDSNTWSIEKLPVAPLLQDYDEDAGVLKPVFVSSDGKLYIDEKGNDDNGSTIPFEIELGRDIFGSEKLKKYDGMFIYSENSAGLKVYLSVDNGQYKLVGQINGDVQYIKFDEAKRQSETVGRGTSVDIKIAGSVGNKQHKIYGEVTYFSEEEMIPHARR